MTRAILLQLLAFSLLAAASCSLLVPPIELPEALPAPDAGDTSDPDAGEREDAEPDPDRDDLDGSVGPRDDLAIPLAEAPYAARLIMLPHAQPGGASDAPPVAALTLQRSELQGGGGVFPESFPTSAEQLVILLGGTEDPQRDGIPLPFELEHLDAERLTIWVRLPSMENTYHLDLYWTDQGSLEGRHSTTAIWQDYAVVLHFDADAPTRNSAGATPVELMEGARVQPWNGSNPTLHGDTLVLTEGAWARVNDDRALVLHPENNLGALTAEVTFRQRDGGGRSPLLWHEWFCFGWRLETLSDGAGFHALATLGSAICDGADARYQELQGELQGEGAWHTLTLVQDLREPAQVILYIDGQALLKESLPALPVNAAKGQGPLHIGGDWNLARRFQGELDEVRIYLGARDEAWVQEVEALRRSTVQSIERLR